MPATMNLIRVIFANRRMPPGWAMPMGWFAWFGVMIPILIELNGWLQNVVLAWSGWLILYSIGMIGTASIGYESVRNLSRFGFAAAGRPRFFFELSRVTLAAIFLLVAPAWTFAMLLPNAKVVLVSSEVEQYLTISLMTVFCITSACGYLTSFVTTRKRRGRAYECTSWFFCLGGGIALITRGYIAIPDPLREIRAAIPGVVGCVIGTLLLGCGVFTEVAREKRTKT